MNDGQQPPGWYPAQGDPPGTVRWWDGTKWVGGPQAQGAQQQAGYVAPGTGVLPNGRELADPWLRFAAAIIEFIPIVILQSVLGGAVLFSAGFPDEDAGFSFNPGAGVIVLSLVFSVALAAYHLIMNSMFSGGIGKQLLGLRIVTRDGTEPLGWGTGSRRSLNQLLDILSVVPLLNLLLLFAQGIMNLVSLIMLFSDSEHRTVMDRIGDTYVVKKQ